MLLCLSVSSGRRIESVRHIGSVMGPTVICQLSCPKGTLYGSKGQGTCYGKKSKSESNQVGVEAEKPDIARCDSIQITVVDAIASLIPVLSVQQVR